MKALITGITGQDGSYLAELLLSKGYEVHGIVRRSSTMNRERLAAIHRGEITDNPKLTLHYGDLSDTSSLMHIVQKVQPDEVYNLGAQSHVRISFDIPEYTADVTGVGTLRLLEAVRTLRPSAKFYQASTSELYGDVTQGMQDENTPFNPQSPYASAKYFAHQTTINYRRGYGLFACAGILFNHESPRRGENFVTKKITNAVADIKKGLPYVLELGNLEARRDWGYAPEYVEAMWRMLQQDTPDDFVIATGETHTVREFMEKTFAIAGIPVASNGKEGPLEEYIRTDTNKTVMRIDPVYYRPNEVNYLLGNPGKAERILGWKPKTTFEELVRIMVEHDLKK
ncbi:MAG: GDP-mannose 4,6-dehydratase [archaeon]